MVRVFCLPKSDVDDFGSFVFCMYVLIEKLIDIFNCLIETRA